MTASRSELSLPVEAQGLLRLEPPDGRPLELRAQGAVLVLRAPGRGELMQLARVSGRGARRRRSLASLGRSLETVGLALRVELADREILGIGSGVQPTWLARLLRLGPARIPTGALWNLWRR